MGDELVRAFEVVDGEAEFGLGQHDGGPLAGEVNLPAARSPPVVDCAVERYRPASRRAARYPTLMPLPSPKASITAAAVGPAGFGFT